MYSCFVFYKTYVVEYITFPCRSWPFERAISRAIERSSMKYVLLGRDLLAQSTSVSIDWMVVYMR